MQLVELMKEAIFKTLEKMFYTMVEFEGEEAADNGEVVVSSYIEISSDNQNMVLVIKLYESFGISLTADFMGMVSDDVKKEDVEDCLKELANMVGGSFIAASEDNLKLGLPVCGLPDAVEEPIAPTISLYVLGSKVGEVDILAKKG